MGGLKIVGYRVEGSEDHLIADYNTCIITRKTVDGTELWTEQFSDRNAMAEWLDNRVKQGLIHG